MSRDSNMACKKMTFCSARIRYFDIDSLCKISNFCMDIDIMDYYVNCIHSVHEDQIRDGNN